MAPRNITSDRRCWCAAYFPLDGQPSRIIPMLKSLIFRRGFDGPRVGLAGKGSPSDIGFGHEL